MSNSEESNGQLISIFGRLNYPEEQKKGVLSVYSSQMYEARRVHDEFTKNIETIADDSRDEPLDYDFEVGEKRLSDLFQMYWSGEMSQNELMDHPDHIEYWDAYDKKHFFLDLLGLRAVNHYVRLQSELSDACVRSLESIATMDKDRQLKYFNIEYDVIMKGEVPDDWQATKRKVKTEVRTFFHSLKQIYNNSIKMVAAYYDIPVLLNDLIDFNPDLRDHINYSINETEPGTFKTVETFLLETPRYDIIDNWDNKNPHVSRGFKIEIKGVGDSGDFKKQSQQIFEFLRLQYISCLGNVEQMFSLMLQK